MPRFEDGSYSCAPGLDLIAKVMAGRCLMNYSRAAVGSGSIQEGQDPKTMTEVAGFVMDGRIAAVTNPVNGECQVTVQVMSKDVSEGFFATGILLYADDPDSGPVPYTYLVLENGPEWIRPSTSDVGKVVSFDLICAVGAVDRVTADIDPDSLVTLAQVQKMVEDGIADHDADPEAHGEAIDAAIEEHNTSPDAHPDLRARISAAEKSITGFETLYGPVPPTTETHGMVGQHYVDYVAKKEYVCVEEKDGDYIWVEFSREKGLWATLDETAQAAKDAKDVADAAAEAIAAVQNTVTAIPSQSGTLSYAKGKKQKPVWNNFPEEMLDVTYGPAKTSAAEFEGEEDAGQYEAYFTPKEKYTWGDKSREEKKVTWTIERARIAKEPVQSGTLTYSGEPQTPTWDNFDAEQLTKQETEQTAAGQHTTTFTPTKNYSWGNGETSGKEIPWTIGRATVQVPTPSALTYNTHPQSPDWTNYDMEKMTIGGQTSMTDAGDYDATFTPTENYQWPEGDHNTRTVRWSIAKAACTFKLSSQAVTVNGLDKVEVVTVTRDGDGQITAQSDAPGIASVGVSGNNVTITGKGSGSANITVNVGEGKNYKAPAALKITVQVITTKVYGVQWDGNSGTKWTRTDDAAQFIDPVAAVSNGNGSSPFDNCMPWKGMVVSTRTGGEMVAIPKFWYKLETYGANGIKIQIADNAKDGFAVSPAHMDRGDGKVRDTIYVGRYHCATSTYKSTTGVAQQVSMTRSAARDGCKKVGTGYSLLDFATRFTLWLLYLVEFADWNSQDKIGRGCSPNSRKENNGATDAMTYHTGTTVAARTSYGFTQYRHIEGLWDNVYDWLGGCYYNASGLNVILDPSKDSDTSGGTLVGLPTSGWPSKFTVSTAPGFACFYPTASSGSESTYSCDYWSFSSSNPCLFVGGYCSQSTDLGLFCVGYNAASSSGGNIGARLQELP